MQSWVKLSAIFAGLGVVGYAAYSYFNPPPESNPITAPEGAARVVVLPWAQAGDFADPSLGWVHRQFWMQQPMALTLGPYLGKEALKCETNNTGSILSRTTDIEVGDYPVLAWDWLVQVPISSDMDETTPEGDDHPARLLLKMEDREGGAYAFEIIWSNAERKRGGYIRVGDTMQYVANGGSEDIGAWQHQEVNLMQIYRELFGRDDYPILKSIAIMCDSDNTRARSVAYWGEVALLAR